MAIARGRIKVNGAYATSTNQVVNEFSLITFDNQVLQENTPCYLMLNKPIGVVSATKDIAHQTVIDLLDIKDKESLHIAGRLDINSTGLLLLTNDGRWSQSFSKPENKVVKRYLVTLEKKIMPETVQAFAEGIHFPFEDVVTKPAHLELISETCAEVSLTEGRYHQIKRMFGRFQNKVLTLHRFAIGNVDLDPKLKPGESRFLTKNEKTSIIQ